MILTRTPFRITLGGGGTDLPSYYRRSGGFIFAAALDKYMFISLNCPVVDELVRVKYTKSETVAHRDDLEHEIAREALRMAGVENGIEITSMADVPAGTGLGSSSAYAVGLLHALHTAARRPRGPAALAEEACELEITRLGKPIGKQDQYLAAFGGLTVLEIAPDGRVQVRAARVRPETAEQLERNLLLFYTGCARSSPAILARQSRAVAQGANGAARHLDEILRMGREILAMVEEGDLGSFGRALDRHWRLKKKLARGISSPHFDRIYERGLASGALGGKLSGAGGGGFFAFYTETGHRTLREAMQAEGLREMRYRFDYEGSKVLVNLTNGAYAGTGAFAWRT
jgi:D-glycero-alpha-D-manno-heptose-7-phosphate kinase